MSDFHPVSTRPQSPKVVDWVSGTDQGPGVRLFDHPFLSRTGRTGTDTPLFPYVHYWNRLATLRPCGSLVSRLGRTATGVGGQVAAETSGPVPPGPWTGRGQQPGEPQGADRRVGGPTSGCHCCPFICKGVGVPTLHRSLLHPDGHLGGVRPCRAVPNKYGTDPRTEPVREWVGDPIPRETPVTVPLPDLRIHPRKSVPVRPIPLRSR